jgi:mycothiol synthase
MGFVLRPYADRDLEALRAVVSDPSLAPQFDKFLGPGGLEHKLHDDRLLRAGMRLALVDGKVAGFGLAWALRTAASRWYMVRMGVRAPFRRRGVGLALAHAVIAHCRADAGSEPAELATSAWMPNPEAEGLAARLGFVHERWFRLMERPRGGVPRIEWPPGVTTRIFDGGEGMLRDWNAIYNDSFSEHYRFVVSDLEHARRAAADPAMRHDGLLLAYRDDACVGFCRNELHATRGEIGTLGTAHAARGIGLGRALLRWGAAWLEANTSGPVTLLVDGENEGALGLYRSEGFQVARTREIWGLPRSGPV